MLESIPANRSTVEQLIQKTPSFVDANPPLIISKKIGRKPLTVPTGLKNITVFKKDRDYFYSNERCSHRGMSLKHARQVDNCLVCPYHGKQNAVQGKLISEFGFLWFEKPTYFDVPNDYQFSGSKAITLNAPFHVVLDNFNEGSHTPFIHKWVGPKPEQIPGSKFSWQSFSDHIEINYQTLQRKNFLFYPFLRNYNIQWNIQWKTFTEPVYMRYESTWTNLKSGKDIMEKNITYFFLKPLNDKKTEIITFVFIKPLGHYRFITPILKKTSFWMTLNQIYEDQALYKRIHDLPLSLQGMKLDQYDQPLVEIRNRVKRLYPEFL